MSETVTLPEAMRRLREFSEKRFITAAKKAVGEAQRTAVDDAYQWARVGGSVARALTERLRKWGESGTPPILIWGQKRLKVVNDFSSGQRTISGGIYTGGMGRLIQIGGKTKPHIIDPVQGGAGYMNRQKSKKRSQRLADLASSGKRLLFRGRNGWVSPRMVRHPGSRMARNPFLEKGAMSVNATIEQRLDRHIMDAARRAKVVA